MTDQDQTARTPGFRKVASVIGWGWGGLSILNGALKIVVGPDAAERMIGLSAVCAGTLLLPVTARWIGGRVPVMQTFGLPTLLAGVVGGSILAITPFPPAKPGAPKAQAAAEPERLARPKSTPVAAQPPEEVARKPETTEAKAEIEGLWASLTATTKPCDDANERVAAELSRSRMSVVDAYDLARQGARLCSETWSSIRALPRPKAVNRESRKQFDKVLDGCADAYLARSAMLNEAAKVLNGDRRPSRLSTVRGLGGTAQAQTLTCVLAFTELASRNDVPATTTAPID